MDRKKASVFIDLENVRIRIGKGHSTDIFKDDFILKLKNKMNEKGYDIYKMYSYDDYQNEYYQRNDRLNILSALGVELKHILATNGFKNSADIQMCLDAYEVAMKSEVETFIIISSDKDMFPLIKKLRDNFKKVILIGVTFNTSTYIMRYVDEFIPLESIFDLKFDENHIIKKDIISAVKRIKNLYDWSHDKGNDLGKDFCLIKLKNELYSDYTYVDDIYEKLKENDIVEEYDYDYNGKSYKGIKFKNNKTAQSILDGKKPHFY